MQFEVGSPMDYGPNDAAVRRLVARAAELSAEDARRLLAARALWIDGHGRPDAEVAALRRAHRIARRTHRLEALKRARTDAAVAFRSARRGEVGPWLSVCAGIAAAATAAVVADLLDVEDHERLYRPWREAASGPALLVAGPSNLGVAPRRHAPHVGAVR